MRNQLRNRTILHAGRAYSRVQPHSLEVHAAVTTAKEGLRSTSNLNLRERAKESLSAHWQCRKSCPA
eukprot:SAG31_NODE_86_length_26973_cov_16.850897_32_plen_67_part_00